MLPNFVKINYNRVWEAFRMLLDTSKAGNNHQLWLPLAQYGVLGGSGLGSLCTPPTATPAVQVVNSSGQRANQMQWERKGLAEMEGSEAVDLTSSVAHLQLCGRGQAVSPL